MSPFGKCIFGAAVVATAGSVILGIAVLASAKVGDGVGKIFPLVIVTGWILSFAAIFPLTSISLYVRARLKKESTAQVRELGFATALSIVVSVVLGASIITRLK
jgi:hypothetical protein